MASKTKKGNANANANADANAKVPEFTLDFPLELAGPEEDFGPFEGNSFHIGAYVRVSRELSTEYGDFLLFSLA